MSIALPDQNPIHAAVCRSYDHWSAMLAPFVAQAAPLPPDLANIVVGYVKTTLHDYFADVVDTGAIRAEAHLQESYYFAVTIHRMSGRFCMRGTVANACVVTEADVAIDGPFFMSHGSIAAEVSNAIRWAYHGRQQRQSSYEAHIARLYTVTWSMATQLIERCEGSGQLARAAGGET